MRKANNIFVLLTSIILLTIKTKSLLLFYIFFELRVVPITLIVLIHGYQPEKLNASMYLLLYTVAGSIPLLLYIVFTREMCMIVSSLSTFAVSIGFIVKSPMYIVHI